jgi:hypothetical protein
MKEQANRTRESKASYRERGSARARHKQADVAQANKRRKHSGAPSR